MPGEGALWFRRSTDCLVRRMRSNQVLRVERAERCCDSRSDSDDAFFDAWPKHCDPKVATEKQLRAAQRRRGAGIGLAINLHLFDCRRCTILGAAPRGGLTIVHLPLNA